MIHWDADYKINQAKHRIKILTLQNLQQQKKSNKKKYKEIYWIHVLHEKASPFNEPAFMNQVKRW